MATPTRTWKYRPRSAIPVTVATWVLAGALVASEAWRGGLEGLAVLGPVGVEVSLLVWVMFYRPSVTVDDVGILVVNPLSNSFVPWAALIDVRTKFTCTLVTPYQAVEIFAAPGPSRQTVAAATVRDLRGRAGQPIAIGDLPSTASGEVAQAVRRRWKELIDDGLVVAGEADQTPVETRTEWPIIVAVVCVTVAMVLIETLQLSHR